jgi:hypothetical protein
LIARIKSRLAAAMAKRPHFERQKTALFGN